MCAGDIRPNLPGYPYRCADEADIQWAGRDLGGAVVRTLARSVTREQLRTRAEYYRDSSRQLRGIASRQAGQQSTRN